ncbi:hypothetical protein EDEG_00934 [Edhazardia aedis USNM 41457]|uniref:HIT domain-containing protein n=1 Tax=Edhazardia aedis (strain USNM 41457) TaxID=1003232 RepID=J8ZZ04_EDHAE|nr:hypothetical protein EDEG_00934 [Edhazardia aedis USNM 41457]|eukprot:EJW04923.1 hypothetical protein EDEG_00934 [Edhazardia aedis USNM 41457]
MFADIEIPSEHIIYETEYSFVFVNLRPFLPNHILVSPKRIVSRVYELKNDEAIDLFLCVKLATKALKHIYQGFTINIQDGSVAGQKVFHTHVHIVPRNENDLCENDQIYKSGALDVERTDRSFEEMRIEAISLKRYFNAADNNLED